MKTTNDLYISKALEEVWKLKEKAYEATKDMSFDQLREHYKKSIEQVAMLLGAKISQTDNGAYKFHK